MLSGNGAVDWALLRRFEVDLDVLDLVRMELLQDAAASWQHASVYNSEDASA